jgi:hypothetical protein
MTYFLHHRIFGQTRALAKAFGALTEDGTNLCDDLFDGDGGKALLAFDDAGLQTTTPAVGLVVDDAMLLAVWKPRAGFIASGEDGNADRLNGCGEMHGAAVMSDEDA